MRRSVLRVAVPVLVVGASFVAACAYEPEIVRPGSAEASAPPPPTAGGVPVDPATTFEPEGCPVADPAACKQAAFLANALVLSDAEAVFDLSRPESLDCGDLDAALFPQCEQGRRLKGYVVGTYQGEFFVEPAREHRDTLAFLVEAVDEEYSDEFGGAEMQVLGISMCGSGADRSYHVVYLVGLGDPDSTLPGSRFIGTYELTREGAEWAIGVTYLGLYTDWQLTLDDPLAEIACGGVRPWTT